MIKFKIFTARHNNDNDKWETVDESANRWMEWMERNGKNVDVLSMSFSDGLICIMYEEKEQKESKDDSLSGICDTCKYYNSERPGVLDPRCLTCINSNQWRAKE